MKYLNYIYMCYVIYIEWRCTYYYCVTSHDWSATDYVCSKLIISNSTISNIHVHQAYEIGLIDDYHVWMLPEMNLNDIRRVAKQYNMCDMNVVLKNALMVGENYYNLQNVRSWISSWTISILLCYVFLTAFFALWCKKFRWFADRT